MPNWLFWEWSCGGGKAGADVRAAEGFVKDDDGFGGAEGWHVGQLVGDQAVDGADVRDAGLDQ